jgi:hypothetical protein
MPGDREYQRAAAFSSQLRQAHEHLKDRVVAAGVQA